MLDFGLLRTFIRQSDNEYYRWRVALCLMDLAVQSSQRFAGAAAVLVLAMGAERRS